MMTPADSVVAPTAVSTIRLRRALRMCWAALALAVLGVGGWGVYRATLAYVRSGYESRCRAARAKRDWPALESLARTWTRWQADRALPWLLAAEAAEERQQHAQAAAYLEQLPDGDPKTPAARLLLVDLYFGPLNQPFAGAATCERILQNDPASGEAHRRLTFFYAMTVQRAKMVHQARKAIDHHCDVPETYVYVIGADWLTFSNAYEWNCRWLTQDPNNELFLAARAVHYIGARALDESADTVEDESGVAKTAEHERIMAEYLERFPRNAELLSYFLKKACASGNVERVRELLSRRLRSPWRTTVSGGSKAGCTRAQGVHPGRSRLPSCLETESVRLAQSARTGRRHAACQAVCASRVAGSAVAGGQGIAEGDSGPARHPSHSPAPAAAPGRLRRGLWGPRGRGKFVDADREADQRESRTAASGPRPPPDDTP